MRLGELVAPAVVEDRDSRKIIKRDSVVVNPGVSFSFNLPYHKADPFYKGSEIAIVKENSTSDFNFVRVLHSYLKLRDKLVPSSPFLFVRLDGSQPSRRWYLRFLTSIDSTLSGHSLRSGGATYLGNLGVPAELICRLGRWTSDSWKIYLRDHASVSLEISRKVLARRH